MRKAAKISIAEVSDVELEEMFNLVDADHRHVVVTQLLNVYRQWVKFGFTCVQRRRGC